MMMLYSFDESIATQMSRLTELRQNDPNTAKKLITKGESLLEYAKSGSLRKLSIYTSVTEKRDILYYYVILSFKECLKNGHLMMADHFIDHGFQFRDMSIPPVLISVLNEIEDYQGVNVVNYLVLKGYDINTQAPIYWVTALHVAVQRGLIETIKVLISHGADVNAVAKDDLMPLSMAESATLGDEIRTTVINLLKSHGARSTWRKQATVSMSGGSSNTMVSFKGGPAMMTTSSVDDTTTAVDNNDVAQEVARGIYEMNISNQVQSQGSNEKMSCTISEDGGRMFSTS